MSKVFWMHCGTPEKPCYCWPMTVGGASTCKLCREPADRPCDCTNHEGVARAL